MANEDTELYSKRLRVENKILFVDLRQNATGVYLKLSERRGDKRNSIIIPARGVEELRDTLSEVFGKAYPSEISNKKSAATAASAGQSTAPTSTVKVGNLSFDTTEATLGAHFSAVGQVTSATIITRNSKDGIVSSGRGIVEFSSPAAAAQATQTLHNSTLDGRPITVFASKRDGAAPAAAPLKTIGEITGVSRIAENKVASTNKIYVGNLSWETTDEDLETYFSRLGETKSASVRRTKVGRSLGQGIVEYVESSAASEAVDRLNNTTLDGREITVRPYYESV